MLQSLNRPALISLVNGDGVRRFAVLAGLTETRATIAIDGRTISAAKAAVPPLWSGDFLILWKPLPGLGRSLRTGMSGKDVVLLRQGLGKIAGGDESGEKKFSRLFDDTLKKQVMAFQKIRGLKEDGIVGTMTQIQLGLAISPSPALVLSAQR